jgi:hypothetical protein
MSVRILRIKYITNIEVYFVGQWHISELTHKFQLFFYNSVTKCVGESNSTIWWNFSPVKTAVQVRTKSEILCIFFMFRWPCILVFNLSQWQTWCTNFNTFITILYMYMFRAISCSSSGGQIVLIQHLVSSLSVKWPSGAQVERELQTVRCTGWERTADRPVHRLRERTADRPVHRLRERTADRPVHRLRENCSALLSQPVHRTVTYWDWRYQMLYQYNLTSWGWARYCSKHVHVEDCNKCIKICTSCWSLAKAILCNVAQDICLYPALHDLHSYNTKHDVHRRFIYSNTQYTNTAQHMETLRITT